MDPPSAADWLTAASTGFLALAAPISIWFVRDQIKQAREASDQERHDSITPHLTVEVIGTNCDASRLGACAVVNVTAIGNGAAFALQLQLLSEEAKVVPGSFSVEPNSIDNIPPQERRTVVLHWQRSHAGIANLQVRFSNALGRRYRQAFLISLGDREIVQIIPFEVTLAFPQQQGRIRARLSRKKNRPMRTPSA